MSIFAMCCQHYLDIGERSLSVQQGLHVHMHTCIKEQKRENDRTGSISRLVKFAFKRKNTRKYTQNARLYWLFSDCWRVMVQNKFAMTD